MNTIQQLIRRWQMINNNSSNYGVYTMDELVRDIKEVIYDERT